MDDLEHDPALAVAARALARVLDLEAAELRADSPLGDLGADAVARVQWADVAEHLLRDQAPALHVEDRALREADTLGDLADALRPAWALTPGDRT
jgi:hypothetical protein